MLIIFYMSMSSFSLKPKFCINCKFAINDIDKLIEGFGEKWILCFFNKYHISYFVNSIEENNKLKKELLNKYDEKFINSIINEFKNKIINKKQYYSYGEHILNAYKAKMGKKIDKLIIDNVDETNILYNKSSKTNNLLDLL